MVELHLMGHHERSGNAGFNLRAQSHIPCKVAEVCHHGALSQLALVQIVFEPQKLHCDSISVVRLV